MPSAFLPAYQHLKRDQPDITGLWLLHGDDPLVIDFFIEALRPLFKKNKQIVKRATLSSSTSLTQLIDELANLSLFGENTALIVSGKTSGDKHTLATLNEFAKHPNGHCLVYTLPKQDKKAQASKLFLTFEQQGVVINCHYNERERLAIIQQKAHEFDLKLTDDSWHLLMNATENNLLGAYQALWQLSLCFEGVITPDQLLTVLAPNAQHNVFELRDSLLAGDYKRCVRILTNLRDNGIAPSLALWAISQEIHTLLALYHKSPNELGIWSNKIHLYQNAHKHLSVGNWALTELFEADCIIKGVNKGDPWQKMTHLCLRLCQPSI